jgi:protein-S-isoprenylcysteine O-methyltransferase Ste14
VLDVVTVRVLAGIASLATVAGIALIARAERGHGRREFRADDSPPTALQALWAVMNLVPQLYPFLVAALPEVFYADFPRFSFPGDSVAQVLGLLIWGTGGLLVVWSGRTLGRFMTIRIAVASDHELIESGPYARVRHPTYAGAMFLTIGLTLLFLNFVLLASSVVTVAIAHYRAFKEERLLASPQGLGDTYREYMLRTGRFLPRP